MKQWNLNIYWYLISEIKKSGVIGKTTIYVEICSAKHLLKALKIIYIEMVFLFLSCIDDILFDDLLVFYLL